MANIRVMQNLGSAIVVGNVPYTRVSTSPSAGTVTDTPSTGDTINVETVTFDYDDDNVLGGPNHRTWTAGEIACAHYLTENYATTYMTANNTPFYIYTAPSDGIIRIWWENPWSHFCLVWINTIYVGPGNDRGYGNNFPYILSSGDVVAVGMSASPRTVYSMFLPDNYP